MADRNCLKDGHCHHTLAGALFQRHNQRPPGKVDVHCCWCQKTEALEGYSKHTRPSPQPTFHKENHGDSVEITA